MERVFSISKYVLSDTRKAMTPQLFEAILFLKKLNERLWDVALVADAIKDAKAESEKDRLKAHLIHEEQF